MALGEPGNANAATEHATRLLMQGRYGDAALACQSALRLHGDVPLLQVRLGQALHGLGNMEGAARCFEQALKIDSQCAEAYQMLGALLLQMNCRDEALAVYGRLAALLPENIQAPLGMGTACLQLGRPEEASAHCAQALHIDATNIEAIALAADIDEKQGHLEQALARLQPLIENGVTSTHVVLTYAAVCRSRKCPQEAILALESLLAQSPPMVPGERAGIHFALGGLCDAAAEYDRAFAHYQQGNALNHCAFDRTRPASDVNAMCSMYNANTMAQLPSSGNQSELPIFVVGMHRSGTSLVEQILSCHSGIHGAGELPDLMQMASSLHTLIGKDYRYPDGLAQLTTTHLQQLAAKHLARLTALDGSAQRVIDKMPGNFMYLGLIQQMFPQARIIHCLRNPLDTCLSGYFQNFGGAQTYMNDLADLGFVYGCYHRMMTHWQAVLELPILELRYEELVADPEHHIPALVKFCGLPWEDECLNFHTSRRFVNTASYDQVRQPMYTGSVGRWKHYANHLAPLREALGPLALQAD